MSDLSRIYGDDARATKGLIKSNNIASAVMTAMGGFFFFPTMFPGTPTWFIAGLSIVLAFFIQRFFMAQLYGVTRHICRPEGNWSAEGIKMFIWSFILLGGSAAANFLISNEGQKQFVETVWSETFEANLDSLDNVMAVGLAKARTDYQKDTASIHKAMLLSGGASDIDAQINDLTRDVAKYRRLKETSWDDWQSYGKQAVVDATSTLNRLKAIRGSSSLERSNTLSRQLKDAEKTLDVRIAQVKADYQSAAEVAQAKIDSKAESYNDTKSTWSNTLLLLVWITTFGNIFLSLRWEYYLKVSGQDMDAEAYDFDTPEYNIFSETFGWIGDWSKYAGTIIHAARIEAASKRSPNRVSVTIPSMRQIATLLLGVITSGCIMVVIYFYAKYGSVSGSWVPITALTASGGGAVVLVLFWINSAVWRRIGAGKEVFRPSPTPGEGVGEADFNNTPNSTPSRINTPPKTNRSINTFDTPSANLNTNRNPPEVINTKTKVSNTTSRGRKPADFVPDKKIMRNRLKALKTRLKTASGSRKNALLRQKDAMQTYIDQL